MSKSQSLSLKNYHLKFLANWLDIDLYGRQARARTQFLRLIAPRITEIENARIEKLREFALKDEKGEPKMKEDGKTFDMTDENTGKFREFMADQNAQEFVVEVGAPNREMLRTMRDLVIGELGDRHLFSAKDGAVYDEVCEEFEKI